MGEEVFVINNFQHPSPSSHFRLQITCDELDSQVTLPYILIRISALLSGVQWLDMRSFIPWSAWLDPDEMDPAHWLDFFCHLKSVTRFEVSGVFVQSIQSAFEQLPEDMVRRVLPALHDLHVAKCREPGPFQEFADARLSSGRPFSVHYTASPSTSEGDLNELPDNSSVESNVAS